jgi:hypothetical protein
LHIRNVEGSRVTIGRPYSNWEGLPDGWTPQAGSQFIADVLLESSSDTLKEIAEVGVALTSLLLYKNLRYGDSALNPVEVFAQGITPRQRLGVRMDDKINRIVNGLGTRAEDGEHPGIDLAGYLVLDIIADWRERS